MAELNEIGFTTGGLLSRGVREVRFVRTETVQGAVAATLELSVSLAEDGSAEELLTVIDRFLDFQRTTNA